MDCPNCFKEMPIKHDSYRSLADWDSDYDICYKKDIHTCNSCNIECIDYGNEERWSVPYDLLPSAKQDKTVLFINRALRKNKECHTKREAWKYIHDNLDSAIHEKDRELEYWCEENQDWLPEIY